MSLAYMDTLLNTIANLTSDNRLLTIQLHGNHGDSLIYYGCKSC
jgi:hypothetical protein